MEVMGRVEFESLMRQLNLHLLEGGVKEALVELRRRDLRTLCLAERDALVS
jgi:hypothetical protein